MRAAEILGRQVIIEGFKNVKVEKTDVFLDLVRERTKDCHIQFFDAEMIAGFDHLYFAVLNALKAFDAGINISGKVDVETLLYASGQHQISRAIELLGIKPDSSEIAVLIIADSERRATEALNVVLELLQGDRSDEVIEMTDEKTGTIKAAFGITNLEIEATMRKSEKEALTSLLIERAALLATKS